MKKAYLIVDMSNDFVDDDGSLTAGKPAQQIIPNIIKRLEEFDRDNDFIVFCMDHHQPDDDHFKLWTPHNVIGTWGAELYGKLKEWYNTNKEKENVLFLPKSEYDAFYQTTLSSLLEARQIEQVRIAGVCTDICIVHTVYGAYKAGLKTIVSSDECATFTKNQSIFLEHMKLVYQTIID